MDFEKSDKRAVKQQIVQFVRWAGESRIGRYVCWRIVDEMVGQTQNVVHDGLGLTFSIPNELGRARADSFSTKEPETLAWIDAMPPKSVVWDIGANVGRYSCYAGKRRDCRVFAFEPSVFNLEMLARNIFLNGLTDRVTIVPLPLSGELSVSKLNMTAPTGAGPC